MKILMAFIIALVVGMWIERVTAPKSGAPLDAIKIKNVMREFYKVRDAANMEAYNNDFNTTSVTTDNTKTASGMTVSGGKLISSQHSSITFEPIQGADIKHVKVTISGLENINSNAEEKVASTIDANTDFDISANGSNGDGIIVVTWEI